MDWLFGSSKKEEEKNVLGPKVELKVLKKEELPKLETSTFKMPEKPTFKPKASPVPKPQVKAEK